MALLALGRHFELSQTDAHAARDAYREALELAERIGDVPNQVELHAAVAQLAAYRADWDQVLLSTDASTALAEREGLTSQLCLPFALRGLLSWRDGRLDRAEDQFREAHSRAEQMGWSELAFHALYGLALVLRDRGDLADAVAVLGQAAEICEQAGLAAQSVQAVAMRAVVQSLDGLGPQARESAAVAAELAGPLNYPIGWAASLEANGAVAPDPAEGARVLSEARDRWIELERPLEAARCGLLAGARLRDQDPPEARRLLEEACLECERVGVPAPGRAGQGGGGPVGARPPRPWSPAPSRWRPRRRGPAPRGASARSWGRTRPAGRAWPGRRRARARPSPSGCAARARSRAAGAAAQAVGQQADGGHAQLGGHRPAQQPPHARPQAGHGGRRGGVQGVQHLGDGRGPLELFVDHRVEVVLEARRPARADRGRGRR